MIHSIAQQMAQGRFELFQNIAIDGRRFTQYFQVDFLVELARKIAHHAGKAFYSVGKRAHTAVDDLAIESI